MPPHFHFFRSKNLPVYVVDESSLEVAFFHPFPRSPSMQPFMTASLLFPVAMGVNDQQDKNDSACHDHHQQKRAVLPKQRNKVANV